MQEHYRQGDVLIVKTSTMPSDEGKKVKSVLVAEGSKTGHKHILKSKNTMMFFQKDNTRFVKVGKSGAELVHDEHAKIAIPSGEYEIRMQREFDLVEGNRQVMD